MGRARFLALVAERRSHCGGEDAIVHAGRGRSPVRGLLKWGLRRVPSAVWLVATVTAVLLAVCLYGYGFVQGSLDLRDACAAEGQSVDNSFLMTQRPGGPFPLSQPCNAAYDLVPSFVNPAIVVLLVTAVVTAVVLIFGPDVRRKAADLAD